MPATLFTKETPSQIFPMDFVTSLRAPILWDSFK